MSAILSARDLTKSYGKVQAVRGVSLDVVEGTCFGLLGPNGAGKTTTIELLEGIGVPSSGSVTFRGQPMSRKLRQHIGIQFQATALQDFLTVRETLRLFQGLYDSHKPVEDIVRQCALDDLLQRDNRKLSGGQRQRLLLAIALINDPELIFLDEPTTGLDPQARRNFWALLRDIRTEGKTIVLTTHYMEEASELCDTIAIMDHGRIIAEGEPSVLLSEHFGQSILSLPKRVLPERMLADLNHAIVEPTAQSKADRIELSTHDIATALGELQRLDVELTQLEVRRMTLEDLFIALTGEALRG